MKRPGEISELYSSHLIQREDREPLAMTKGSSAALQLEVIYKPPKSLVLNSNDARKHSSKQINQVARSIAAFGFLAPVVIDKEARVVAGHARVAAAIELGQETIPTVSASHLTDAELRAYAIADNRLA